MLDSNEPTLSPSRGKDLHLITPTDNKNMHPPNGLSHVVVGGDVPAVRADEGHALVLAGDPPIEGTIDVAHKNHSRQRYSRKNPRSARLFVRSFKILEKTNKVRSSGLDLR